MLIHIYFNVARLMYSFSDRRDRPFVGLECAASAFMVISALLIGRYPKEAVSYYLGYSEVEGVFVISILWGVLFILLSLLSRTIYKKNPIELNSPEQAQQDLFPEFRTKAVSIGIIDLSWLAIMAGMYALVLFASESRVLAFSIKSGMKAEYYQVLYSEVSYLFGKSIDAVLLLGTILAACMTILWGGQIWNRRDGISRTQYTNTTVAAMKMVIAYLAVLVSVGIWVSLPLFSVLISIKSYIK